MQNAPFLAAALFLLVPTAVAQVTGDLKGVVTDPSGGVVQQAKVTLVSRETGQARVQESDASGRFVFDQLRIGAYDVKVEAAGFRQALAQGTVRTGETADLGIRLEVGGREESVTVSDAASALDTTNSQVQVSVDGVPLVELPVQRDPVRFAQTAPGVVPVNPSNPSLGEGNFNVNGGRGRGNNITVDDVTATDLSVTGLGGFALNYEQIKEVKLITNNFNAEYGRNANSQLLFITRGGSNDFHGAAFEFLQNSAFNARDFFDRTGAPAVLRNNDFGYALGGRIIKNKTHFYTTYEGIQTRGLGGARIAQVPTPAQLSAVIDPASKQLLSLYKLPSDPSGQVEQTSVNQNRAFQFSIRVDEQFTQNDSLTARFAEYQLSQTTPALGFLSGNLAGYGATATSGPRNLNLAETHLFGTTLVNEARFAYGRSSPVFAPQSVLGPRIQFSNGLDGFGEATNIPQGRVQNTFQATDILAWVKGAHNVKLGANLYRYQLNSWADAQTFGAYTFNTWNDFANGNPVAYSQYFGGTYRGYRITNQAYFLQDDWRVSHRLTINLGVRVEPTGGVSEVNGLISNVDLSCRQPQGAAGSGPLGCFTTGKPVFNSQVNWAPRVGFAWSPFGDNKTVIRGGYGMAYDFIYLNLVTNQRFMAPFIQNSSLSGTTAFSNGNTFDNLVAGTAPLVAQTIASLGKISSTALNFGSLNPGPIDTGLRAPQVQQWSFGIERELYRDLVLKASYIGTKGDYLERTIFVNPILGTVPATSTADEQVRLASYKSLIAAGNGTATQPSNRLDPRFNDFRLVDSGANSVYDALQVLAQKRFGHGYSLQVAYTWSKSIDDVSDALGVLINDSSAQQDPNNNANNRGVSQFDIAQRLVISHVWEVPFGKNLRNHALRSAFSGWAFSGISTFRTGFPVSLTTGSRLGFLASSLIGQSSDIIRPNVTGPVNFQPVPAGSSGAPSGLNRDPFQPISAYAGSLGLSQPLLGNIGALGRNTLRLCGQQQFDWSIFKRTHLSEKLQLELRGDAYNIFNNHAFQDVQRTISSSSFGQYTDTSQSARYLQLGARLEF